MVDGNLGLSDLGWSEFFRRQFAPHEADGLRPGRVISQEKLLYLVHDGSAELWAELSGRFRHEAGEHGGFPAVGDWVAVRPHSAGEAIIHALVPRRTAISRKVPLGLTAEQVIAANVDTVFLVTGLDQEFNPRRIERYVAAMLASGATPVVVLNKTDICPNTATALAQLGPIQAMVSVLQASAAEGTGLEAIRAYARPGETLAFVGSSGVGKSTIINRLLGAERQQTGAVSQAVGKGQHVTTRRELIPLPGGGLLMDTPGLRELQLWGSESDVAGAFEDVEALARQCRFRDCRHDEEPGCAVRAALEAGTLDPKRLHNFEKMQRELRFLARRQYWAKMKKHQPRPPDSGRGEDE
ncbi:ribosome small subunit-dependent GTPase A [candidate division WOR-3 bacterium]|uniref:Small ribosomal subunit biogenesis GTPase RsgA n=1 Tax=candidate division WOR-3 bacterium TaxID=2052148 RepID=A0A937XFM8_UNCW3|nr:ribosome small subunit-dependent GTPase A [candidate division WOR-3 bacterium]